MTEKFFLSPSQWPGWHLLPVPSQWSGWLLLLISSWLPLLMPCKVSSQWGWELERWAGSLMLQLPAVIASISQIHPLACLPPPSLAAYSGPLYPGFSPESSPFTSCSLGLSTQGGLFLISLHLSSFQAIQPSGYDGLSCLWAIVSCSSTHQHRLCTWVLLFKIQVFKACRELNKRTQSCNYC